ncbi:MAG: 23S rRNA (adenine(2503)-C(2))-methyltransferase RlmN, partial [Candidatus Aureabacteria bacterium]|nr:23S rRNA (adenine(2503)-C(2))-methyltransferase RlmN [Candidatus Auribacterota bacterium]
VIKGFNDGIKDIKDLIDLLKGFSCKINLIPFNSAIGTTFEVPEKEKVLEVGKQLKNAGMNVTVRWSKGADADAACGQLRYLRKAGKIKD